MTEESTAESSATRIAVLDRLAALEIQRRADREKRREEAKQNNDPRENVEVGCSLTALLPNKAYQHSVHAQCVAVCARKCHCMHSMWNKCLASLDSEGMGAVVAKRCGHTHTQHGTLTCACTCS